MKPSRCSVYPVRFAYGKEKTNRHRKNPRAKTKAKTKAKTVHHRKK
jgi:hypothetical protein